MIHGMGEQRPLETLNEFLGVGLKPAADGLRHFYSRPDRVTDSYEARRYLAPRSAQDGIELHAQTEFFEYHWAYHRSVAGISTPADPMADASAKRAACAVEPDLARHRVGRLALLGGPLSHIKIASFTVSGIVGGLLGGGLVGLVAIFLVADVIPGWLNSSFVDVVRYLDTSPRSYAVRHDIRKGIVDLLQGLHDAGRYQRIVVVAHSLGSYIGYDAISFLWGQMSAQHRGPPLVPRRDGEQPDGLRELEEAASALIDNTGSADSYQDAQRRLWLGLRKDGNPWLITDFISFGSPMYFADQLVTRDRTRFDERVAKRELPTCPPCPEPADYNNVNQLPRWYSWKNHGRRVLYHGAPFAVVRWTNLWFPAHLGFLGDWFGGPLSPLFGAGIREIPLTRNRWRSWLPGYAHALYLHFLDDERQDSVTTRLRLALDLASTAWLSPTLDAPAADGATRSTPT